MTKSSNVSATTIRSVCANMSQGRKNFGKRFWGGRGLVKMMFFTYPTAEVVERTRTVYNFKISR